MADVNWKSLVEDAQDGYWVLDREARTAYANPAMCALFGYTPEEFADLTAHDLHDEVGRGQFAAHYAETLEGTIDPEEVECLYRHRDGSMISVLVRESLWLGIDGEVMGAVYRVNDHNKRDTLVEELIARRRQSEAAATIARVGGWEWDLRTNAFHPTDQWLEIYELSRDKAPATVEALFEMMHPDDEDVLIEAAATLPRGAVILDFEIRLRARGRWVWSRVRGNVHRDDKGRATRVIGIHQDIDKFHRAELRARLQARQQEFLREFSTRANETETLVDMYCQGADLLLAVPVWRRARGFQFVSGELLPIRERAADAEEDLAHPDIAARMRGLAEQAVGSQDLVWSEDGATLAAPVIVGGEVVAAFVIEAHSPITEWAMVTQAMLSLAEQSARVHEREQLHRNLGRARDEAMSASRQKSQFLATMSHEIRTPLNGVIGLAELLGRERLTGEQMRLLDGVRAASQSLLSLLNDVLDFSKIEAGQLLTESVPMRIDSILANVSSVMAHAAHAKQLILSTDYQGPESETYLGDPTKLMQILTNLVSNAIKFTPDGSVRVQATVTRPEAGDEGVRTVDFEVADSGVGIDAADLPALLQPFRQADASTTREFGGSGLGLAITVELVAALGGELRHRTADDGRGSVFGFSITTRAVEGADVDEPDAAVVERTAGAKAGALSRHVPRILVVEDQPVNQEVAAGMLTALGYHHDLAENGEEALAVLVTEPFDAILMDVQMPVMDGYTTARQIRAGEGINTRTPIIAMTATALEGERQRCLDAGMDDYLTKPVTLAILDSLLRDWVGPPPNAWHLGHDGPMLPATPPIDGLDVTRLDELRDLDPGDTSYLDRAIGNFAGKSTTLLEELVGLTSAGDLTLVHKTAHKLAGSASNLGVLEAARLASQIEDLGRAEDVDPIPGLLEQLERALADAHESLRVYQATYKGD